MRKIVVKEFSWDCAHVLENHEGLCKNVHGHTYKMQVGVVGHRDYNIHASEEGMIIDFKHLKERITHLVVDKFDHAFVIDITTENEFTRELEKVLRAFNKKVLELPFRTTAENMVEWIEEVLIHDGFDLAFVRLYETPTSYAEVRNEI